MQVYSLLALPSVVTEHFKTILIAAAAVVGVIAFLVGFFKRFSRLSWGATIWTLVAVVWFLVEGKLHDKMANMGALQKLTPAVREFVGSLVVLLGVILAAMFVFGILAAIVRPKKKNEVAKYYIINEARDPRDYDEDDVEDYEVMEDEYAKGRMKRESFLPGAKKPNFFDQFIGSLINVANVFIVLAVILSVVLLVIPVTPAFKQVSELYSQPILQKAWKYIHGYTLDVIFLGIMLGMAYSGSRSGFFGGLRGFIRSIGTLASLAFAIWFPMTKNKIAVNTSGFFENFLGSKLPESVAKFSPIIGKICCGIAAFIVALIVVAIVGAILKALSRGARRGGLRLIDGTVGAIVMLLFGVVLAFVLASLLYLPGYFGLEKFAHTNFYSSDSVLAEGLFGVVEEYVKPLLDKVKGLNA